MPVQPVRPSPEAASPPPAAPAETAAARLPSSRAARLSRQVRLRLQLLGLLGGATASSLSDVPVVACPVPTSALSAPRGAPQPGPERVLAAWGVVSVL